MFGQLKLILIGIMLIGATGGIAYVYKLKADNAVLQENQIKLEEAVEEQQQVIAQQKEDFESILQVNKELNNLTQVLQQDLDRLDDKFNKTNASGKKRDIGDLANARPSTIERIVNRATANAQRCVEIAMGSPLTEKEINATKKSEINSECSSLANPNYVNY